MKLAEMPLERQVRAMAGLLLGCIILLFGVVLLLVFMQADIASLEHDIRVLQAR